MNRILYLFITFIFISGCSLNKNSKFWTSSEKIKSENLNNYEELFPKEEALKKEFNSNLSVKLSNRNLNSTTGINIYNNYGKLNFDGDLKKSTRYKFSKIKSFNQHEPEILFFKDSLIFFDNKGSVLKFDDKSKLIWKKNYYTKSEKKMNPILEFSINGNYLIVTDNLAKYYLIDIISGNLIWIKDNFAPFKSQIKTYKDKFFVIDFSNTLRCFSIKDGKELWNLKTDKSLIKSQKKLSMVIVDEVIYFNNSIGDISAVELNNGQLLWQLPTQSNLIYESAFSLETSDIITDGSSLFFSNNRNKVFSIDIETRNIKWENKINSNLRPTLIDDFLFSISLEGYLIVINKNSGNIIRVTDIFKNFKINRRDSIIPTGFIIGLKNIYLTTSNGRLLVIDTKSGNTISTLKIDNEKISRPFVKNKDLFLIKNNAIIKLN